MLFEDLKLHKECYLSNISDKTIYKARIISVILYAYKKPKVLIEAYEKHDEYGSIIRDIDNVLIEVELNDIFTSSYNCVEVIKLWRNLKKS